MREIDCRAIAEWGIPGIVLMENAAIAVVNQIETLIRDRGLIGRVLILAGKGNNGGDGLAIARQLLARGFEPWVYLLAEPAELTGDARLNWELYERMGGSFFHSASSDLFESFRQGLTGADVVVDALYGTGFRGQLPSAALPYIDALNAARTPVVAVDIASGIDADSGQVIGTAVRADVTVTFGLPKLGHYLREGPAHSGRIVIDPISIPAALVEAQGITTDVLTLEELKCLVPRRQRDGHKGTHGRGVLIGGSTGMSGAVILAGRGALRSGIGLLQIVTPAKIAATVENGVVEGTVWPTWPRVNEDLMDAEAWPVVAERLAGAQACAVGPGLKQGTEFIEVLENILKETTVPLVLDADALNLLAGNLDLLAARRRLGPEECNLILTPHPGEMARLCQCSIADVQQNRLNLAAAKAREWNAVVVLKGANTVIAAPGGAVALNPTGNPGLGTGGTGDVLTGSILAWLAQGLKAFDAACLGVYIHGRSGDILLNRMGTFGFTAGEVADTLSAALRELIEGGPGQA